MKTKGLEKREFILTKAKEVFITKGFNRVTMKDIIDACQISRGGIYLYFGTVEEIFIEVVNKHNQNHIDRLQKQLNEKTSFDELLEYFLEMEKTRLLNMDNSLFMSMSEFCFSQKNTTGLDFYTEQFNKTKEVLIKILDIGKQKEVINPSNTAILADSIMFLIEGLREIAVASQLSENLINDQLNVCRKMIYSNLI